MRELPVCSEPVSCAESGGAKEGLTGKALQELAKQPESVLDPNRWYKILEVCIIPPFAYL